MAKASEKKRSTTATATMQLYQQIIAGLYVAYFLTRICWFWSSWTFGPFLVFIIFSLLNYFCLGMVGQALELGTSVSGPQDVLFINWIVMGLSLLWDKAFLVYLAIPAYLIYQYGGLIKSYLFPPKPMEVPLSEADLKRNAKKERQAERQSKFAGR